MTVPVHPPGYTPPLQTFIQSTPHKCPKCDGRGWLSFDPYSSLGLHPDLAKGEDKTPFRCDVCESGIIWSKP